MFSWNPSWTKNSIIISFNSIALHPLYLKGWEGDAKYKWKTSKLRNIRVFFSLIYISSAIIFVFTFGGDPRGRGRDRILAPYIFRSYDKKFQKSTINICFVVWILVFAPQVYIELPLGSSKRELHFWAIGYWLLTYSWTMIKNFRNLRSIFALSFAF